MSDEVTESTQKTADETAAQNAQTGEENAGSSVLETNKGNESKKEEETVPTTDFKVALKRAEEAEAGKEKAENTIVKMKQNAKKEQEQVDNEAVIQEQVDRKVDEIRQDQTQDLIDVTIEGMSSDPDERELIKYHYNHSVNKSGFSRSAVQEDLKKASAIASHDALVKTNSELAATADSKKSISNSGSGTSPVKSNNETTPELSQDQKTVFDRMNHRRRNKNQKEITTKEYLAMEENSKT